MTIADRIQTILNERHAALPRVQRLTHTTREVVSLGEQVADHARSIAEVTGDASTVEVARRLGAQPLAEIFRNALDALSVVEARLRRGTINVGVSGQARVGKSTLLQSISGLGEEQIPTGSGLPVTAVRSRIFHDEQRPQAVLKMHSWQSFRLEVLAPYHRALGLREPPGTIGEFQRQVYEPLNAKGGDKPSHSGVLRRLHEIHGALDSFAPLLRDDGGEVTVSIEELRPYVAYPPASQQDLLNAPRPYVAVRDVRIYTRFPKTPVAHLGLLDLPGLGELAPDAERHHLDRLRNEVDLVLMVKRPLEGLAFWREEDARAMDLIDEARGAASRSQFVLLVVNDSGESPALRETLLGDIRRKVNEGEDGRHFQVLSCNVRDPEDVHGRLLRQVLEHLAVSLPEMDRAVVADAEAKLRLAVATAVQWARGLDGALRNVPTGLRNDLVDRADEFHKDVAAALEGLLERLFRLARQEEEDSVFIESVDVCMRDALSWIDDGFGKGAEAWKTDAHKTLLRDRNSIPHASMELNRIRVEISHRFSKLDDHLGTRVERILDEVADALSGALGTALGEGSGRERLKRFRDLLDRADEPLGAFERAVDDLLAFKFAYRAQIHPRVRRALDGLNVELTDGATGERHSQVQPVTTDPKGVELLLRQLRDHAEQAVYNTRKGIVVEALLPALAEHAAVEQFTDALLRSQDSRREFRLFVAACEEEIWPGAIEGQRRRGALLGTLRRLQREFVSKVEVLQREVAT